MTHVHTLSLIAMLLLQTPGILALAKETSQTTSASHLAEKQRDKVANDRYESLLKESPDDANLHFEYGKTLLKETGSTSGSEGLQHLRKAVKLDPENNDFNRALFSELVRRKKYQEAMRYKDAAAIPFSVIAPDQIVNPGIQRMKEYDKHLRELPDTAQ